MEFEIFKKNIPSLLSLASSTPIMSVLTVLDNKISNRDVDVMSVIEAVLLEGNVSFIEEMYFHLWKFVSHHNDMLNDNYENENNDDNKQVNLEVTMNAQSCGNVADDSLPSSLHITIPVQTPASASACTSSCTSTSTSTVRSSQIDWYRGVKGHPSCPIAVLGGDVQITDGCPFTPRYQSI